MNKGTNYLTILAADFREGMPIYDYEATIQDGDIAFDMAKRHKGVVELMNLDAVRAIPHGSCFSNMPRTYYRVTFRSEVEVSLSRYLPYLEEK